MKVAFVGKGGSGKSTLSALFIRYLQRQGRNLLAIDADLNMNLAGLLGLPAPPQRLLSDPEVADAIRTHLKGANPRIRDIGQFLPTTPPGTGSNLIRAPDEPLIRQFSARLADAPSLDLLAVGTYAHDGIGQTCYHSHLFVAENLLSHIVTNDGFGVVCDMAAGTDAFAYSMHLQFDALVLVAEPTPESVEVCNLFLGLAQAAGIAGLVHLVANKAADQGDSDFIARGTGRTPCGLIPFIGDLKRRRQRGENISDSACLDPLMALIERRAGKPDISQAQRRRMLCRLHDQLNGKSWVRRGYGDVSGQVDPHFFISEAQ